MSDEWDRWGADHEMGWVLELLATDAAPEVLMDVLPVLTGFSAYGRSR